LAGIITPDEGEITVAGISLRQDPVSAKRRLAYVPDKATAYPFLTGRQFLEFVKSVRQHHGIEDLRELVDGFGLVQHIDKRFDEMSLGTQKKFFLLTAFIDSPPVVFMDEPTNAIDKQSRALLADLLSAHRDTRLVLFATHDTKFAEQIGARLIHMSEGQWSTDIAGSGHHRPVPLVCIDP
jgi:heme-transporting ATPase